MIIKGNNGKASAHKRQPKSAPSSSKSKRSNSVPKSPVFADNGKAPDELDGNIVCDESRALQSEASAVVLEETGIIEGTGGTDLPDNPTELTAITVHQPWASLIAKGCKQYETRDWPTSYRGSIAIHAGRKPKGKQELREHDKVLASFKDLLNEDCPYSSVIAIACLTDVILMTDEFIGQQTATELRCGNWAVGRYAFKLENVRAIEPIAAAGKQGLWKWEHRQNWEEKLFGIEKTVKYLDETNSWKPAEFGELHHVAEADGQLNLLEWVDTEPPDPDDYEFKEEFQERYKEWAAAQPDKANDLQSKDWEKALAKQLKVGDRVKENLNNPEWGKTLDYLIKYGEIVSDIYPGKYEPLTLVDIRWDDGKVGAAQVKFLEKVCNQLMDGSTCVQELEPASPMPESNCGDEAPTSSANGTTTASDFSKSDSLEQSNLPISNSLTLSAKSPSPIDQESSQLLPPANPSAMTESDSQQTTIETASPTYFEQSENSSPTSQLSKTSPASSTVPTPPATNPEPTSDLSSTPYPRAGTMRNGVLSAAPILPPPGVANDCLLLRSPGALSGSAEVRPPGKTRLETQLNQSGLIQDGEVVVPEFLEAGYNLPAGWTNPQENRTALELAQVQAQQLPLAKPSERIDHKSESPAETEPIAIEEQPWAMPLTGESQPLVLSELNISVSLPPNIGALSKSELIGMAQEQHQLICVIERKEFELAIEKLHRVRLTGVYLQEFKKKCQYGEFENQLEQAGIGIRSAQNYMAIAKNWEIVEAKTKLVALLTEENQPAIGLKWALEAVRDEKKQLKSAAPPKDPDGWRTPNTKDQPIVDLVKKALGGQIWLDPCSGSVTNNIPCAVRYFKNDNGLAQHQTWSKTVFVNPPFSDPLPWVERCCFEFARGNVSAAIMLLKAGTISNVKTGELINKYASAICHWRGRINFLNDEGNAVKGSDFDCVFIYFGTRLDLFRQAFGGRGTIATIENHYSSVNKKYMTPNEKSEFGNVEQEQKQLAAAVGLGNGRSILPDMRDADRERNERYDPHTVLDVLSSSMPTTPAKPVLVSENLVEPLAEPEIFDETPLATRQFETAKHNTLNDYITAISSNLSAFSNEQIAFLAKIVNEESAKRIGS
jgi:hypothetical protein